MAFLNTPKTSPSFMARPSSMKYFAFAGVIAFALLTLFSQSLNIPELHLDQNRAWKAFTSASAPSRVTSEIPNTVHFVFVLPEGKTDFSFLFFHYLSVYSVKHFWKPDTIYLHTNADDGAIERARSGARGKWNKQIFNMPGLRINRHVPPEKSNKGQPITAPEHMSDFARVEIVLEHGGVYIDLDVFALRDIKPLRQAGFNAVLGRESGGKLNCGILASQPQSKALKLFLEGMHDVFDPDAYAMHCVDPLTEVGERLVADEGEVLIVDREAFHPMGWEGGQAEFLYGVHEDSPSNLEGIRQGDPLPEHKAAEYHHWERLQTDKWDRKFYASYMIHGFHIERFNITPRSVLERQSVFSRAVYPVARAMYMEGLMEIEDTPQG